MSEISMNKAKPKPSKIFNIFKVQLSVSWSSESVFRGLSKGKLNLTNE